MRFATFSLLLLIAAPVIAFLTVSKSRTKTFKLNLFKPKGSKPPQNSIKKSEASLAAYEVFKV